jgi:hypothetical protein
MRGVGSRSIRLAAEVVKNLSAASGIAYKKFGAILTSLRAPNAAPNVLTTEITPPECLAASVSLRRSMLPSPHEGRLGLWGSRFEAISAFTLATAR